MDELLKKIANNLNEIYHLDLKPESVEVQLMAKFIIETALKDVTLICNGTTIE